MSKGFDTTSNVTPHIQAMKNAGFTFVCRYYSHSAWKNLTPAEAKAISGEGLYIVAVWESAGDHASFFTQAQGELDGESAYAFGQMIGQPFDTPIYFAVDYDADPHVGVSEYFNGVRQAFQRHGQIGVDAYHVGVYGSGAVCQYLDSIGYVSYTWLAQSTGWLGSASYADYNIKQGPGTTLFGMQIDTDTASPKGGGGFQV